MKKIQSFCQIIQSIEDFAGDAQRQFVKKPLSPYKYTHYVNEYKTCIVFV
jgi:hypothetical protein